MARGIFLLAMVLVGTRPAWATDEADFLGILKRYGIVAGSATVSKKPCLCNGGILDQRAGTLVVFRIGINYVFECRVPNFNAAGDLVGSADCEINGGSTLVISK